MSENTLDLINAIANGDAVQAENSFQAAMSEKIGDSLDTMRQDIAKSMFSSPEPVVEEEVDLTEEDKDNDGIDDSEEADINGDGKHDEDDHKAPTEEDDDDK